MCPLATEIQTLFKNNPAGLARKRIPIAERALRQRLNPAITSPMASPYFHNTNFALGTNQFEVTANRNVLTRDLFKLTVSHFGSVFDSSFVHMLLHNPFPGAGTFVIKAFQPLNSPKSVTLSDFSGKNPIGNIDFNFNTINQTLFLSDINSDTKGLGGRLLVSLYNFAVDLRASEINFSVWGDNMNARQFYFHMDFGRPVSIIPDTEYWELEI